jgi:hypothetical protein
VSQTRSLPATPVLCGLAIEPTTARGQVPARHYHLVDNRFGDPHGYRDEVFPSRRIAEAAARARAQWLAMVDGLRVEALSGRGRYLVTTGLSRDPGRMIEVEVCDEVECLEEFTSTTRAGAVPLT